MTTDVSFCQQRKLAQLYNIPLARYTPSNPYSSEKYTKAQLDMRRKAEILKYSANKSSTQTNKLTKKQIFSLLVRGGIKALSQEIIKSTKPPPNCSADEMMPTPTSSCDVPGPVTFLYNDESVPLYNYSDFNTRTYPDFVPTKSDPWQFVVTPNVVVYNSNYGNAYYLIINNHINQPRYTYSITTPIGIAIEGIIPVSYIPPLDFSGNVKITITSISLGIYYSDNLVKNVSPSNLTQDYTMSVHIPIPTPIVGRSFSAIRYIGNLQFNKIQLYTAPTYVYKFTVTANINETPNNSGLIRSIAVIANMSSSVSNSIGCTISNAASSNIYAGASITGK
jgi:hypothetical protein